MTAFEAIRDRDGAYVMQTYGRQPVAFVRGDGARLWDSEGREYLDFLAGIAVASVGHAHPAVTSAVRAQAGELVHVSNLFYTEAQGLLAERLHGLLGWGRSFFCNSGAEANEAAIKLARRATGRAGLVTALGSFHGRTIATLAATGQPAKHEPFSPLPAELMNHIPFNDEEALEAAIGEDTSAVLLEVVQGEGGVHPATAEFLRAARKLCDERGALLIFDEVQTGLGRTGSWFAFRHTGVEPDIVTLAKALGGGLPIGACIAREEVAAGFGPGDHATTFGGGPVPCRAALAVLDVIESGNLVQNAAAMGERLTERLTEATSGNDLVAGIRGLGLLVGLQLTADRSAEAVERCLAGGLVVNNVTPSTIRLSPPLVVREAEVDRAAKILGDVLAGMGSAGA
ncbi:MAG TPA: acetylornithine transaminase [Actinomycetota bacterium]|nr:acetylornithine transaminase [Actinomycetota bacterium]